MNHLRNPRYRGWLTVFLLGLMAGLAACDGDRGPAGPAGPPGPAGPAGPTVPSGEAALAAAERIDVAIDAVTVPAGGGAPVVELELRNELGQGLPGLPADTISFAIAALIPGAGGESSAWQSYLTRSSAGIPNAQATTEAGTVGLFEDLGAGDYRYTFSQALTDYPAGPAYDASRTHRLGVEIRSSTGGFLAQNVPAGNAPFDFVPAGAAPVEERLIVDNDVCNACHDRLAVHGDARSDVGYCVVCHNPSSVDGDTGNSVDMKIMIHKIHRGADLTQGYQIIGFGGTVHDFSNVRLPQDIRNCTTCHDETDAATPQAINWREVANRAACGSCHDDIDWAGAGHPGGIGFVDDTQCLDCHGPAATVTNSAGRLVRIAIAHEIPAELARREFQYNIVGVTDTGIGQLPQVRFSVTDPTNADAPYDLAVDSEFTTCAQGSSRLAILIAWNTDEFTNRGSGSAPSQPVSINPLPACGGASTDNLDGTYSVTSPVAVPATTGGSLAVAIEGHPWRDLDGNGQPSSDERIGVPNAIGYAPIGAGTATPRRQVVDIAKCNDCHASLSVHGNNRSDAPEVCATCHNPNATDINMRAGQCLADLGADDSPLDFKVMVHRIHASGATGVPFEVCGFGNSAQVFDFAYPGKLNDCEGCHVEGSYYPSAGAARLATTVDAGADPIAVTDDTVVSPNAAVCSTCHVTALAAEHMRQNGADFAAAKAADGSLISAGIETCALCHGPGRLADVELVHGVDRFLFND